MSAPWIDNIYPLENDPYAPAQTPSSPEPSYPAAETQNFVRALSENMKGFLHNFYSHIRDRNVGDIENDYLNLYPKFTDQHFKQSKWPSVEVVAPLVNNDGEFLTLYKELYYRHIYAHVTSGPSLEERFESYYNYCTLFNLILNPVEPIDLELPNQWLWGIIDEFIYQFQNFTQFRNKLKGKKDDEVKLLKQNPKIWNIHSVLNVLHSLVDKSNINEQLRHYAQRGDPDEVAGPFGGRPLYKMLGFFGLIGLCRLHCLLGDYFQALKVLEHIDITRLEMYHQVQTCHITTGYYVGFSYLMMHRYRDAIRTFSAALLLVGRARNLMQARADQQDYVVKQADQMYTLLCICLTLHPMRIDEAVQQHIKDKFSDKITRLQKMEMQEFETSFVFSCPKFLSPVPPNYDVPVPNYHLEPQEQQCEMFRREIQQQLEVPRLRSYLKLYSTLPIVKLAAFLNLDAKKLHLDLMCYKHKLQNMTCTGAGSGLEGELQSGTDIDFYVDGEMIHVADIREDRRFSEYLLMQIQKIHELNLSLDQIDDRVQNRKAAGVGAAASGGQHHRK